MMETSMLRRPDSEFGRVRAEEGQEAENPSGAAN